MFSLGFKLRDLFSFNLIEIRLKLNKSLNLNPKLNIKNFSPHPISPSNLLLPHKIRVQFFNLLHQSSSKIKKTKFLPFWNHLSHSKPLTLSLSLFLSAPRSSNAVNAPAPRAAVGLCSAHRQLGRPLERAQLRRRHRPRPAVRG